MLAMTCGAIFAIACEPACQWLTNHLGRFKRLAPLLTVLMVLGFVVTPLGFVVGFGRADFATLSSKLGDLQKASVIEGMSKQTAVAINSIGLHVKSSSVLNGMREAVDATHGWLRGVVKASVKGTADALLALTIFLLTFYVWLREHQRLQAVAMRLLPLAPAQALRFVRMVRDSSVDAVVGACLVGLVQAGVLLVALLLLGVPGAWLLAIVAFFL